MFKSYAKRGGLVVPRLGTTHLLSTLVVVLQRRVGIKVGAYTTPAHTLSESFYTQSTSRSNPLKTYLSPISTPPTKVITRLNNFILGGLGL